MWVLQDGKGGQAARRGQAIRRQALDDQSLIGAFFGIDRD
jgi:hypothetical protein